MQSKNSSEQKNSDNSSTATKVGSILEATRVRVDQDLREISDILRIRYLYLEAIEECQYQKLPGETYAVGFIRAYAEHLGLDSEDVVKRYKLERSKPQNAEELIFPSPMSEGGMPKGAVFLIGFFIAILAYSGWYFSNYQNSFFVELVGPIPERLSHIFNQSEISGQVSDLKNIEKKRPLISSRKEDPSLKTMENIGLTKKEARESGSFLKSASDAIAEATSDENKIIKKSPVVSQANLKNQQEIRKKRIFPRDLLSSKPVDQVTSQMAGDDFNTSSIASGAGENVSQELLAVNSPAPDSSTIEVVNEDKVLGTKRKDELVSADRINETPSMPKEKPLAGGPSFPEVAVQANISNLKQDFSSASIVIRALSNSWIQIRDDAAEVLILTRLLKKGDTYEVPKKVGLSLSTGNAGALEIVIDGTPVPPIGAEGEIKRGVVLDPKTLYSSLSVPE